MQSSLRLTGLMLALLIALTACGGGSGGGPSTPQYTDSTYDYGNLHFRISDRYEHGREGDSFSATLGSRTTLAMSLVAVGEASDAGRYQVLFEQARDRAIGDRGLSDYAVGETTLAGQRGALVTGSVDRGESQLTAELYLIGDADYFYIFTFMSDDPDRYREALDAFFDTVSFEEEA